MPRLSILIPIYNVEKYLQDCLDSVIKQTFSDVEIICINDGSTDSCGAILADYEKRDSRIKVINKPNTGYGHSMNVGLDLASGEYIGIVESDDYIAEDFFEKMYNVARENNLDIVKGECTFTWPSEGYNYVEHYTHLQKYFGELISKDRLWLRCQFMMNIWTGLYKSSFLEEYDIRFNETPGASYQDNGFWLKGMIYADRVMFTSENGYFYRQDNASASVKDSKKIYAMVDEYVWLADQLDGKISHQQMNVVNAYRLIRGYWSLFRIDDSKKREFCDRLISDYLKYGHVFTTDLFWQEHFYKLITDPYEFCKQVIDAKANVEKKIEAANSIIIYGAGKRGERLFRLLCDQNKVGKLQCFVESKKQSDRNIASIPVYSVDDEKVDWDEALVVISVADGSKVATEMETTLRNRGIHNFMGSDVFFDNYYVLS